MKKTRWINFALALPYTLLVSYPLILILCIFAARGLRMERDGTLTAEWRHWVVCKRDGKKPLWRWSTTVGHIIVFQPGLRLITQSLEATSVRDHEGVHVLQTEDLMAIAFLIGVVVTVVTGNWILGLSLWASGGLWQSVWFLTSGLRYGWTLEGVYRQSEHEIRMDANMWALVAELEALKARVAGMTAYNEAHPSGAKWTDKSFEQVMQAMRDIAQKLRSVK